MLHPTSVAFIGIVIGIDQIDTGATNEPVVIIIVVEVISKESVAQSLVGSPTKKYHLFQPQKHILRQTVMKVLHII